MKFSADKCQSCLHVIFANVLRQPLSKWCRLFLCFWSVLHRLLNDICATQGKRENVEHITMNEQKVVWSSTQTSASENKPVVNKLWIECEWNVEVGNKRAKYLCFKVIYKVKMKRKCRSKRMRRTSSMITKPFNIMNILLALRLDTQTIRPELSNLHFVNSRWQCTALLSIFAFLLGLRPDPKENLKCNLSKSCISRANHYHYHRARAENGHKNKH